MFYLVSLHLLKGIETERFRRIITKLLTRVYIWQDDAKRLAENLFKGNNQASWNGPYYVNTFNGTESNIIIYFCDGFLEIETMARPRQLLIIVTCGEYCNDPSKYTYIFKSMNEAVKQNLVRKIGDTNITTDETGSTIVSIGSK